MKVSRKEARPSTGKDSSTGTPTTTTPSGTTEWHEGILCGFDTETTGIDTANDRIVSASIVVDVPGEDPVVNEWLVNPGIDIPLEATAVHGISTEHARLNGMNPVQAITEITGILSILPYPVVVVNASFDFTLLINEGRRHGIWAQRTVNDLNIIDTLICDRMLDPYRRGRRTLTAVAAAYGVTITGAHQATGDTLCAIKLARAMGRAHPEFGAAPPRALQAMQAEAYRKWAEQFEGYRRREDPSFTISRQWPYTA